MTVRPATAADLATVLTLLRELAAFEGGAVAASLDDLRAGFAERRFEALLAEHRGEIVGVLTILPSFSSWRGRPGAVIHDLYVRERVRGQGVGQKLVAALLAMAPARGWARIDVAVLDWNRAAQRFYARFGLVPAEGWQIWRLEGEALEKPDAVQ